MGPGLPKQYLDLGGRPVLEVSLERLATFPGVRQVLVGLAPGDRYWESIRCPRDWNVHTFTGGRERADTVLTGLELLDRGGAGRDLVLVHDAVRPLVSHEEIDRLVDAAAAGDDGALLALPVADTLKEAGADGCAIATLSRERMWRALTPQCFRVGVLLAALRAAAAAGSSPTDESAAMERAGFRPRLVAGWAGNIKITTAADLALARVILERRRMEMQT
jgi:2-C-methyl-D-erythritol 4-phosphate cytidylyltransferase